LWYNRQRRQSALGHLNPAAFKALPGQTDYLATEPRQGQQLSPDQQKPPSHGFRIRQLASLCIAPDLECV
jgi:hypothetical protein